MLDDLNTPSFIAKIHELYKTANDGDKKSKKLFNSACRLLGLFNFDKVEWNNLKKKNVKISEEYIFEKINDRTLAKIDGNFVLADKIRDELLNKGIEIEDQRIKRSGSIND